MAENPALHPEVRRRGELIQNHTRKVSEPLWLIGSAFNKTTERLLKTQLLNQSRQLLRRVTSARTLVSLIQRGHKLPEEWSRTSSGATNDNSTDLRPLSLRYLVQLGRNLPVFLDTAYYAKHHKLNDKPLNSLSHFIVRNFAKALLPHPLFNLKWYEQRYKLSDQAHPFVDYLVHLYDQPRDPNPLFDSATYVESLNLPAGTDPLHHYLEKGHHKGIEPSALWITDYWQHRLNIKETNELTMMAAVVQKMGMMTMEAWEAALTDLIASFLENDDFDRVLSVSSRELSFFPSNYVFLASYALGLSYKTNWTGTEMIWTDLWNQHGKFSKAAISKAQRLLQHNKKVAKEFPKFLRPRADTESQLNPKQTTNVCIYTAVFGQEESDLPSVAETGDIPCICFTDRDITAPGWTIIKCDARYFDTGLDAAYYKLFPNTVLRDYCASIYINPDSIIPGKVKNLISSWLIGEELVVFRHAEYADPVQQGAAELLKQARDPRPLIEQLAAYIRDGVSKGCGLYDTGFIWRKHTSKRVHDLMDDWWAHLNRYTLIDQISFSYIAWKNEYEVAVLPTYLGEPD